MSDVKDMKRTMVVRHPDIADVATVTVAAYEDVYRFKGWEPVTLSTVKKMDKDELKAVSDRFGIRLMGDESGDVVAGLLVDAGVFSTEEVAEDLKGMKKDELLDVAKRRKVAVPSDATKDEVLETLQGSQEAVNNG